MASNFQIFYNKNSAGMILKLYGDFDATSACELVDVLKKRSDSASKIFIHSEGLKNIHPFGLDIFRKSLRVMECPSAEITATGHKAFMSSLEEFRKCT
jgi:stage II sporulation protein AA (anti-sigma F factor antagonist)